MKKRIVGLLIIIAVFTTMLGLIISRAKYVFSSKKFYDEIEMEQNFDKGYDRGAFENRDDALYEQFEKYVSENIELKKQNETLQNDNSEKQNELNKQITLNEELQNENENLKVENAYLENLIKYYEDLENSKKEG